MISPLALYAEMLRSPAGDVSIARFEDGSARRALIDRWLGPADHVDERALAGLDGPVLDIGCGPGRHLRALARRGVPGLGVDLSPVAVGLARGAGARAIVGSIFDELPRAGGWRSALLLDGNIGIGGCPERLLRRVRALLAPGGQTLIELTGPDRRSARTRVRLETPTAVSEWFDWAEVSSTDVDPVLEAAELSAVHRFSQNGRWFVIAQPTTG